MDRRTFFTAASLGALSLTACSGGGADDPAPRPNPTPTPPPTPPRFATGWSQMPPEDLRNLPLAGNANFPYDRSFVKFDLLDPAFLASIGWPTLIPSPHPEGQGRQPSCTAWAVGYAAATATMRYAGTDLASPISPADLFTKTLRRTPNACTHGSMINLAMDALVQEGATTLAHAPYIELQCGIASAAPAYRLDGFSRVPANDTVSIQGSIQMMQPVSFGMHVDDRFQSLRATDALYVPSGSGGGHAMTIVGYDNGPQRYKIMNSWGSAWGERGTFWISYVDFARFAQDVCIPYLRRAADNELLAKTTSNPASPIIAQHMKARRFGVGIPGSYGVGVEMGWAGLLQVSAASVSTLDSNENITFNENLALRQIARGIRFGTRIPDAAANYTYVRSSITGLDSAGVTLTLSTVTRPPSR